MLDTKQAIPAMNKVVVDGVNMKKKSVKARGKSQGGIISIAMPIDASNVKLDK